MRLRTVLLLFIAVGLAGGTAMLARAWLAAQRAAEIAEAAPLALPTPAKSVPVTLTSGISGFIFPGDQVDLLITYQVPAQNTAGSTGGYEHKAAETVLHDVRVIAIDQRLESKAGEAVVAHTATMEVTPKQS